jgi:hypothetical protein
MAPTERNPDIDRDLTLQFVRQLYEDTLARYGKDHEQTLLLFKYLQAAESDPIAMERSRRTRKFPMGALSDAVRRVRETKGQPKFRST